MLKTPGSSNESASRVFKAGNNKIVRGDNGKANETVVDSSKSKNNKSEKFIYMPNIKTTKKANFLIANAKKLFNHLWLAFIKALIL